MGQGKGCVCKGLHVTWENGYRKEGSAEEEHWGYEEELWVVEEVYVVGE